MPRSENSTQQMILKRYACVPINLIKRRKVGRKLIRIWGKWRFEEFCVVCFLKQDDCTHTIVCSLHLWMICDIFYCMIFNDLLKCYDRCLRYLYTWILLFPNFSIFYFWNKREKKNFIKRIKREIYISKDIANIFLDVFIEF